MRASFATRMFACILFLGAEPLLARPISEGMRDLLSVAQDRWKNYGAMCPEGDFPTKLEDTGECDDGDSLLFNALLCASGEELGCDAARRSQDEWGQWWRSPRRPGGQLERKNSFSRDMAMGALTYLAASQDREAAIAWMDWLDKNKKGEQIGSIKLPPVTQFCGNGEKATCIASPGFWALAADLWRSLELPQTPNMLNPYRDFKFAGSFADALVRILFGGLDGFSEVEVQTSPLGYQLHLKAVQVYIYQKLGFRRAGDDIDRSSKSILRRDPGNLFFQYLERGSSEELAKRLLAVCPKEGQNARRHQWAWERETREQAWRESMGWDCVFLSRLLLE